MNSRHIVNVLLETENVDLLRQSLFDNPDVPSDLLHKLYMDDVRQVKRYPPNKYDPRPMAPRSVTQLSNRRNTASKTLHYIMKNWHPNDTRTHVLYNIASHPNSKAETLDLVHLHLQGLWGTYHRDIENALMNHKNLSSSTRQKILSTV